VDSAPGRGFSGGTYDRSVTILIAVVILAVLIAVLYMRGLLSLGNPVSFYQRIRLALLLAVVAILIIGILRILGIGTGD